MYTFYASSVHLEKLNSSIKDLLYEIKCRFSSDLVSYFDTRSISADSSCVDPCLQTWIFYRLPVPFSPLPVSKKTIRINGS